MAEIVTIAIDEKEYRVPKGKYILEICNDNGIPIPTLCHHEAVEPWGGCRLCVIEFNKKRWDDWWTELAVACLYPAEDGLKVWTRSEKVQKARKTVLDLLLARCPDAKRIQDLAREHGIYETSYHKREEADDCILCGLCTRVCDRLGAGAISTVSRGASKRVDTPYGDEPPDCIGCLSCAHACPTEVIRFTEADGRRTIWGKTFDLVACAECGVTHVTRAQVDFAVKTKALKSDYFETCDACKRKKTADMFDDMFAGMA